VSLIGGEGEKERGVYYVTQHFSFSPQHGQLLLQPFCLSFSCEQHTYDDDRATSNTTTNGAVHQGSRAKLKAFFNHCQHHADSRHRGSVDTCIGSRCPGASTTKHVCSYYFVSTIASLLTCLLVGYFGFDSSVHREIKSSVMKRVSRRLQLLALYVVLRPILRFHSPCWAGRILLVVVDTSSTSIVASTHHRLPSFPCRHSSASLGGPSEPLRR